MYSTIRTWRYGILLTSLVLFFACSSTPKKQTAASQPVAAKPSARSPSKTKIKSSSSMMDAAALPPRPRLTSTREKDALRGDGSSPRRGQDNSCRRAFERYVAPIQQLTRRLLTKETLAKENQHFAFLSQQNAQTSCKDTHLRNEITLQLGAAFNRHSGKIGVLLNREARPEGPTIYRGIEAKLSEQAEATGNQLVLLEVSSQPDVIEERMAQLLIKHQVSFIIAITAAKDTPVISSWINKLMIPTIFVAEAPEEDKNLGYFTFFAYPKQQLLAQALLGEAKLRGIQKLALLRPNTGTSDILVHHLEKQAPQFEIQILQNLIYAPGNYPSMEATSRRLFRLDPMTRQDELREAVDRAKKRALEQNVTFNPKMVSLPPLVEADAVFIGDEFRMVRHFAKIFQFHGVQKITMLGSLQWRSPGLLVPFDPFLEGAFFADFIGSYQDLPTVIRPQTQASPFFLPPSQVADTDYLSIGYRVADVVAPVAHLQETARRLLVRQLPFVNLQSGSDTAMRFDPVTHSLYWPTSILRIKGGSLTQVVANPLGSRNEPFSNGR